MTSVVGILNKRGIALAADSAVTRKRNKEGGGLRLVEKCTKNGNKMVRLSGNTNPAKITVMFTGNAEYLGTPWDVIARRYRQKRGDTVHATVEDAAIDFFEFIAENLAFWNECAVNEFMDNLMVNTFYEISRRISRTDTERDERGEMIHPDAFIKAFKMIVAARKRGAKVRGLCPKFKEYSIEKFRENIAGMVDSFLKGYEPTEDEDTEWFCERYPKEVLEAIRPDFEEALLAKISSRNESDDSAELIFCGFGAEQEYPSLVPATVCGGFDFHVNYHIRQRDVVSISDERPVAICPFAQKDVIKSIIMGIHTRWWSYAYENLRQMIEPATTAIFNPFEGEEKPEGLMEKLREVKVQDLLCKFPGEAEEMLDTTQREWEEALANYDLEEMAALADSLIELTGFHRILTFSEEQVGGTVDLAVMSKEDGFNWLRRKNWYHKDNGLSI